ncbi:inositol monophosphatase family protein [Candidatus Leptofilum sp.]|uniref:inositol monophosphatase family protein n=1 Tax=Candidatus Leptofilum sp. TaxID=3241576 RepID=UPI003B5B7610
MNLDDGLATAVAVAREAGKLLLDGFSQQKKIERKSSAVDWVTQYDKAAEELIFSRLRAEYPSHGFIGEEGTDAAGAEGYTWYVDPLDGTNNFAHGFPIFCVSIALYQEEKPLLGVIFDPTRGECFTAVSNQGAHLTTAGGHKTQLHVSTEGDLVSSLLATGFPYDRQTSDDNNVRQLSAFLQVAQGIRRPGSAALDLAYVAAGRLDGYWEFKLHSWDIAAGILLVQEAGGTVTFMDGAPFTIQSRLSLVVSNGRIHDPMLAILKMTG